MGPVHAGHLRLRNFRNYEKLDVDFSPGFHLFLGQNAQGKTNLLESLYLLATLRSFRGVTSAQMVKHGQSGYFVGATVQGEGQNVVKLFGSDKMRSLTLNGQKVRRLSDYIGRIKMVVFCSEDMQLIKGAAGMRRRFLDLLLVHSQVEYLNLLQQYQHALRSRNALLKQHKLDEMALEGFSRELAQYGDQIIAWRRRLLPQIEPLVQRCYQQVCRRNEEEKPMLIYHSSVRSDMWNDLLQTKARERVMRATLVGPHRDDLLISLSGQSAAQFASEGQKRTLAIAIKMAQVEYFKAIHGSMPIILIDDVMGELDAARREGFLPLLTQACPNHGQVFMTCTEQNWPKELGKDIQVWNIENGAIVIRPHAG